jgi:hypothetical protein
MAAKAGLALATLVLLVGCSSGHPASAPAPTASKANAPTPSTVSTGPSAKASASASADTVASWAKSGGLDKIDAVTTDITAIHDAGSDASKVRDACAELETSANAGEFYRPIPQPDAQQHWAAALGAFKSAAGECLAGIDENKPELLKKTSSDIDKGTTELVATTKTLRIN